MPGYLRSLACRLMVREPGARVVLSSLADVNIDTLSGQVADHTFDARLRNGQTLTAIVQHVFISLPRDRFNVTLLLDGKPHMRISHLDLDIFAETTIDGQRYILHCFPEEPGPDGDGKISGPGR